MHELTNAFYRGREKLKKKQIGAYFDNWAKPKAACHVGAIIWGFSSKLPAKGTPLQIIFSDYPEFFGEKLVEIPCEHKGNEITSAPLGPEQDVTNPNMGYPASILVHLNDEHDGRSWPDKRIALWLDEALTI